MKKFLRVYFLSIFILLGFKGAAQLVVSDNLTAQELTDILVGEGVVVLNPTLNGTCPSYAVGKFNGVNSNLGIDSGIVLTNGRVVTLNTSSQVGVNGVPGNFANNSFSNGFPFAPGDPDLDVISGLGSGNTHDACVLEFDFVPAGDSIKFDYVFGSEEYPVFPCGTVNDAFGFIISGPGFTGLTNIALVPGTNVPISINSINEGTNWNSNTPCAGECGSITNCHGPYTNYYINNVNLSTTLTYNGMTTVLTALAAVSACDTYHLKLAIADGGDASYDSGVFLKAGSLTSTAITVKTYGGAGLELPYTNTVRGCPPGRIVVNRNGNLAQPVTIPLMYGGTAVNGVDYVALPNSITIPAGDTMAELLIHGIPVIPAAGVKSCVVSVMSPYTCGNGAPVILSSDTIDIYDSIYVKILTPDTAICLGESVDLEVEGDELLQYTWTPSATVSEPNVANATVTPTTTTTYTVSVTLDVLAACPASTDKVKIKVKEKPIIDLGPDVATCGDPVQLNAATEVDNPDETFSWTPANSLSDATIRNPVANPATTTQYIVTVNPGAVGCDGIDTVNVRILPDHINVLNGDTAVCAGTVIPLRVDGDTAFAYNWTPEQDVLDPFASNTDLVARQSGYYTLTASFPGCRDMPDSFYVEVQPVPVVNIGEDRIICAYDTAHFYAAVTPENYSNYVYDWSPGINFSDSTVRNPIFKGEANQGMNVGVVVTTPLGCRGSDSMMMSVNPGDFLDVTPLDTSVCPPAIVQLHARGAQSYSWTPALGLDDAGIANPLARPETTTEYVLVGKSALNCYDTQRVFVQVFPNAVVDLPDSVTIWSGESYQMSPGGNALYYSWFPPSGLSAVDISNPVANPEVRTRYFVRGTTEEGCVVEDSIDVLVNTEPVLDVPNAFSPNNGDYRILRRGAATLSYFRIFNRWGNVVFETTDINKGWDGKLKDTPQPVGVYIYTIEAVTPGGKVFHKEGNLTLIR